MNGPWRWIQICRRPKRRSSDWKIKITPLSGGKFVISPSLRSDLAPTGTLRVGINYGNPVLATQVMPSGELRGVAVDLATEVATRTALPVKLVGYDSAGKMVDALQAGEWDVAFLAVDPGRAEQIGFTAPYLEIEGTYLVAAGSPLRVIGDVD